MANQNPIIIDQLPDVEVLYEIPKTHKDTMIYVTVKIELLRKNWKYAAAHNVILDGNDLYPHKVPEPKDVKTGYGKDIHQKKIYVSSHVSRFRDEAESDEPSEVRYHLIIEAGDKMLDYFTVESTTKNPSNFYSLIVFNQL